LQIEYSLVERTVERELIPMSKALSLGVLAWSPLAKGVLSGKYHGEGKARKVSQLLDNLASVDLELTADQLKSLDQASRIEPGFPQSLYEREMVGSIRYGGTWDRLLV
jgi:aryl-alcohol dehydrogenase-like predicted oxidoreductase